MGTSEQGDANPTGTSANGDHVAPTDSSLVKLVETVSGSSKEEKSSTGVALPIALILLGLVVVGFAVLGIMLVMARRKAAALAAQVRKLEEDKLQAIEEIKLAENEKARFDSGLKVDELKGQIEKLRSQLDQLQTENKARAETLSKITNWDDLIVVDRRGNG